PLIYLSLGTLDPQLVVGVEAGVERKKLIEYRGEQEQIAFAQIAIGVHAQLGADAAYGQTAVQSVNMGVVDVLEAAEQALADLGSMLVGMPGQVVGLEDDLERLDIRQRQIIQRHVADQLPQEVAMQRRRVTGRDGADIAKPEKFRGTFAGLADIAQRQLLRQVLIGTGQLH